MIIAVTGHRPNKLGNEYDSNGPYSDWIRENFIKIIEEKKPTLAISGMALGVDMIWAETAYEKGIKVLAAIPFKGQECKWPEKSRNRYSNFLQQENVEIYCVCEGAYTPWKMQARNEYMVDKANILLAVWDKTPGGTANCVKYAQEQEKDIIYIDPNGWKKGKQ